MAIASIGCAVAVAALAQSYTPRQRMDAQGNVVVPEAQVPNPQPLPERPGEVPMQHRSYARAPQTNHWFVLYLGALNRRVYGIEPHETWLVTTVEPKVTFTNGAWVTRF